jgi:hypothetical protein
MKRAIIASVFLLGAALAAHASTEVWNDDRNPPRSGAEKEAALQRAGGICDRDVGVQTGAPSSRYRKCMAKDHWVFSHLRKSSKPRSSGAVTYNRDSRDPNVGWHWEGGMRTCSQDCDNPEIPGSGFTCNSVTVIGMAMRECDKSN